MTETFFKCTLLSDVILNSKLATEGNMTTLNYIPGSNFLGIVAKELYQHLSPEEALRLFHSQDITFGDAILSNEDEIFYRIPFNYMMIKGKEILGNDKVYLQHLLTEELIPRDSNGFKVQLKQKREGFISSSGKVIINPKKSFSLKSAQDSKTRRSKEGAMFGFESLRAEQQFIFSIKGKDSELLDKSAKAIIGIKRIGKSKTAEFGQVKIEEAKVFPKKITTFTSDNYCLVYAQSDLCFFDEEYFQPTFRPRAQQFGLNGRIDWSKSQIRTTVYSPWNGQRNTTESQRNCILAGSVFYVDTSNQAGEKIVGEYRAEGLGRVIINPQFLKGCQDNALLEFTLNTLGNTDNYQLSKKLVSNTETNLGKYLKSKYEQKKKELLLSKAVMDAVHNTNDKLLKISSSQWGSIRGYALKENTIDSLYLKLFNKDLIKGEKGFLTYGVAYDKYWGKNREKLLIEFEKIFITNQLYGCNFIAKYAAEIAKKIQKCTK